jgi:hypothetical protein
MMSLKAAAEIWAVVLFLSEYPHHTLFNWIKIRLLAMYFRLSVVHFMFHQVKIVPGWISST